MNTKTDEGMHTAGPVEREVRPAAPKSGLVERLRAGENFYAESSLWYDSKLAEAVDEAADEIERLSAELAAERERCAALCDGVAANPSAGDDSDEDAATLCARLIRRA